MMADNITSRNVHLTQLNRTDNPVSTSTVDSLAELEEANRRFGITLIPCVVYVGVLIIIGIIGNTLVCYVFGFRLKRDSVQNFLILCLAVFDLLSCIIGMPAELVDIALQYKFESAALCQIMRFVNTFTATSSICILMVIAIDRYRRIRKPLETQITSRHARLALIPICVATLIFSGPAFFVYGIGTVDYRNLGIKGLDCTISDQAKLTIVPLVYNSVLFLCFFFLVACLIVMYSLILRGLKEHARSIRKPSIEEIPTGHECLVEQASLNQDTTSMSHKENTDNIQILNSDDHFSNSSSNSLKKPEPIIEKNTTTDQPWKTMSSTEKCELEEHSSSCSNAISNTGASVHYLHPKQADNELEVADNSCIIQNTQNDVSKSISEKAQVRVTDNFCGNNTICENDQVCLKNEQMCLNNPISKINTNCEKDTICDNGTICESYTISENDTTSESGRICESHTISEKDKSRESHTICNNIPDAILENATIPEPDKTCNKISFNDVAENERTNATQVTFNVSGIPEINTEQHNVETIATSLANSLNVHNRKMSQTLILPDQEQQACGYLNPGFKLEQSGQIQHDDRQVRKPVKQKVTKPTKEKPKPRNITRKTTIIAFVVTLVFIISFVPHLGLQIAQPSEKGFDEKLEGAELVLFNIFLRSYFINSVANPIIYGVMNIKFRAEVKLLIARLQCWRRR